MCWLDGTAMIKTLQRDEECPCNHRYRGRRVSGEEEDTRGWDKFNDDKSLKRLRSVPKLKKSPINDSLVSLVLVMLNNEL